MYICIWLFCSSTFKCFSKFLCDSYNTAQCLRAYLNGVSNAATSLSTTVVTHCFLAVWRSSSAWKIIQRADFRQIENLTGIESLKVVGKPLSCPYHSTFLITEICDYKNNKDYSLTSTSYCSSAANSVCKLL